MLKSYSLEGPRLLPPVSGLKRYLTVSIQTADTLDITAAVRELSLTQN